MIVSHLFRAEPGQLTTRLDNTAKIISDASINARRGRNGDVGAVSDGVDGGTLVGDQLETCGKQHLSDDEVAQIVSAAIINARRG